MLAISWEAAGANCGILLLDKLVYKASDAMVIWGGNVSESTFRTLKSGRLSFSEIMKPMEEEVGILIQLVWDEGHEDGDVTIDGDDEDER